MAFSIMIISRRTLMNRQSGSLLTVRAPRVSSKVIAASAGFAQRNVRDALSQLHVRPLGHSTHYGTLQAAHHQRMLEVVCAEFLCPLLYPFRGNAVDISQFFSRMFSYLVEVRDVR